MDILKFRGNTCRRLGGSKVSKKYVIENCASCPFLCDYDSEIYKCHRKNGAKIKKEDIRHFHPDCTLDDDSDKLDAIREWICEEYWKLYEIADIYAPRYKDDRPFTSWKDGNLIFYVFKLYKLYGIFFNKGWNK